MRSERATASVGADMGKLARPLILAGITLLLAVTLVAAFGAYSRATFPGDKTPEGAYARIVLAISEGHPRDCFAYLETQAQWASYTIHDYRAKAAARIAETYPEPEKSTLLGAYRHETEAKDGADVWLWFAEERGFLVRLRKDLSGVRHVEISGERASVETARGTRYAFRRRENGISGPHHVHRRAARRV